jgi:hypothetical protein
MSEFVKLNSKTFYEEFSRDHKVPSHIEIVEWLKRSSHLEPKLASSNFKFLDQRYCHYMMNLRHEDGCELVGHGRSSLPETALLKAFGEVVERLAMKNYFASGIDHAATASLKRYSDGTFQASDITHETIPNAFSSSNGWAVHFNLKDAVRNAIFEAVERHVLQLNYWNNGLRFLEPVALHEWNGYKFHIAEANTEFTGMKVIVCAAEHRDYQGLFFGHQILESREITQANFHRAGIEAFQLAEAGRINRRILTVFDEINYKFADSSAIKNEFLGESRIVKLNVTRDLNFAIMAWDLGKSLDLGFPSFAVWAYSDCLLPLYLGTEKMKIFEPWLHHRANNLGHKLLNLTRTPFL